MLPITPAAGSPPVAPTNQPTAAPNAAPKAADNPFEKLLAATNQDQLKSDQAINDFVTGKNDNVQQVVMQVAKSDLSFQLFMEVRNQLIESYNELMRMQF